MCGIVGLTGLRCSNEQFAVLLNEMTDTLGHRGPDDRGVEIIGNVGLGHRRLSIIDLSPRGHQPMSTLDDRVWIVYNGEFYDYRKARSQLIDEGARLRSTSDTEVILQLYLKYGSAFDDTLDHDSLAEFLTFAYIQAPRTVLKKVRQLPPGHMLIRESGAIRLKKYWEPRKVDIPDSEDACIERFEELFNQSIRRRLVADVEVGAFLSGGIDSTAIGYAVCEQTAGKLKTFNIRFPSEGYFDESGPAKKVAAALGTDHYVEDVTPHAVGILQSVVHHYDDPYADSSAISTIYLARMTAKHVKVSLSGTGADDTLAGYRRYYADSIARVVSYLPRGLFRAIEKLLVGLPTSRRTFLGELNLLVTRFLRSIEKEPPDRYLDLVSFIVPQKLNRLIKERFSEPLKAFRSIYDSCWNRDPVSQALWLDLQTYLPGDLLVKEDRATMAYGLESRVPFLDTDLVNFAVSLPPEMKMRRLTTKYVLRRWAKSRLPGFVIQRKKHGFAVPVSEWMREDLKEYSRDVLLANQAKTQAYLDPEVIRTLWEQHQKGFDHGQILYSLLILELWLQSSARVGASQKVPLHEN